MSKLVEPRWELEKYEGKIITVIARYEKFDNIWNIFKPVILSTGEEIDHMNLKLRNNQKVNHNQYYKITGKIIKYKSQNKIGGYDWGFEKYKLKIEPVK